jgi:hypothetical protein
MSRTRPVANELRELLLDCIEFGVLPAHSPEAALAARVARRGLHALTREEHRDWERKVLPIVSQPIQILVDRARF